MSKNKKTHSETFQDISRKNWAPAEIRGNHDQLRTGALIRIAEATEAMAVNFVALQKENERLKKQLEYWKGAYNRKMARINQLERSHAGLRGYITRLKKQQESMTNNL